MYQLIIFDWDGTLMDSAQKIANCIQASARELELPEPPDSEAKRIIGLSLMEAMRILFPEQTTAVWTKLVEAYRLQWLQADQTPQQLFGGVLSGLEKLNSAGVMLAVATGKSRAGLQRVFTELAVDDLFVATRCADETRSKPHPQMLKEILDFTAINPNKAIMVGDTIYDVQMANNANIDSLGVSYGVHESHELRAAGAIAVVDSFAQLLSWFERGRLEPAFTTK